MNQQTLTGIEIQCLKQPFNFADGHAYQDLETSQLKIIESTANIWRKANKLRKEEAETDYIHQFIRLSGSTCLNGYKNLVFCPTASNSIDLVGAWLSSQFKSVALLEPTFDNLALLLKRRKIPLEAINENEFHNGNIAERLQQLRADALFLVNPNNPTGRTLSKSQWLSVISICKELNITLIIDSTFRFFVSWDFCLYQLLLDNGVTFICIEDSGKVFPTLEMKCSMVIFSDNISQALRNIYEEFYLRHSNFILILLSEFMKDAADRSIAKTIFTEVENRRLAFRRAIDNSILEIDTSATHSTLSIEWCRIKDNKFSSTSIARELAKRNIGVLPGCYFFWSNPHINDFHLRFALLKPTATFSQGLNLLESALEELSCIC